MTPISPFLRTLDQELTALLRGASLECLVCGEFVLHGRRGVIACAECGASIVDAATSARTDSEEVSSTR